MVVIGALINVTGLIFAIFYPNVGAVLAYFGAVSGFLCIYTMPVLVHLSMMKTKIENQIAAQREFEPAADIEGSETYTDDGMNNFVRVGDKTGKPVLSVTNQSEKQLWRYYYIQVTLHSFVILYGLAVMIP